ncbi:MAG: ABC transporter ATP-binding protein [Sphaerobacter thermophilus]|jgi:ABC-2 type transport system ATP-binding protein|uniref:ABC transporter ATP-binding protein n=1 Tax=Sphaerobacter thermophilus TaxID=2057 RepID=UPI00396E7ECA
MGLSQNGPPAIEFAGLTKRFGTFVAVDRLTFSVPAGSVFGFLGPNGAGKTTTIGMLLGLIEPDEGTATIFGHDVRTDLPAALARTGALVERPSFYPYLSGRTNLRLMARIAGIDDPKRIDAALEMVDLTARANANFGGYSQGMKQRLGIAAALLLEPDLLILDEPTNGLDPAGQHEIRSLIRDLASAGRTIFLSSHLLHEVQEICTHVAIIHRGTLIASGPLAEILAGGERLAIRVDRPEAAADLLRRLPVVRGVEEQDGHLLVDAPVDEAAALNRALVEAGFAVSALGVRESRLEERFLALTEARRGEG